MNKRNKRTCHIKDPDCIYCDEVTRECTVGDDCIGNIDEDSILERKGKIFAYKLKEL